MVVAPMRRKRETHTVGHKPAKSGEFDDTVIANLPGLGLGFVGRILHNLKDVTPKKRAPFWLLTWAQYEKHLHAAVVACGLKALHITPHSARHGGASTAAFNKLLSIKEIQKRGRWLAPKSVRRYEKSGKLTRQVALMPKTLVRSGEALLKGKLELHVRASLPKLVKQRRER